MKRLYVLLAALFLITGLAACGNDDEVSSSPTPVDSPAPNEAQEPDELEEDNDVAPNGNVSLFEGPNWSMEIVSGWTVMEIEGFTALVAPGISGTNINVVVENMQGMSLDDYVDASLEMLMEFFDDFELFFDDYIEVNGKDAILIIYATEHLDVYLTYQFIVEYNGTAFIITYTRMDETDFSYDVMDMVDTFTIR